MVSEINTRVRPERSAYLNEDGYFTIYHEREQLPTPAMLTRARTRHTYKRACQQPEPRVGLIWTYGICNLCFSEIHQDVTVRSPADRTNLTERLGSENKGYVSRNVVGRKYLLHTSALPLHNDDDHSEGSLQ